MSVDPKLIDQFVHDSLDASVKKADAHAASLGINEVMKMQCERIAFDMTIMLISELIAAGATSSTKFDLGRFVISLMTDHLESAARDCELFEDKSKIIAALLKGALKQ